LSDELAINIKGSINLFNQSRKAYTEYHSNNGQYLYAKKLRVINEEICMHAEKLETVKEEDLKKAILELKEHLEQWMFLWDKTNNKKHWKNKEEFVFTGYKTYPKRLDALLNCMSYE
jgi:hypothetical protein